MDYIAMILTAVGTVTTGRRWAWGWIINALGSILWAYLAVQARMWGLCILSSFLVVVACYNFYKWIKNEL